METVREKKFFFRKLLIIIFLKILKKKIQFFFKHTKLGWNSLMETVRDNTGESNPADIFAAHNEEVQLNLQKELLNEKLAKNEDLKKEIDRKNWEVQMRQKFLEENQKMID